MSGKNEIEKFGQADELIKALRDMNSNEHKFMFYALSQREKGQTEVITTVYDILKKLQVESGGKQLKTYQKAIKNIRQKSDITVMMKADRLSEKDRELLKLKPDSMVEVGGSVISTIRNPETNQVVIKFNKDFLPLLDDLKYNHTWIYLEQVAKLDGKYSARFYEFCKMHLKNQVKTSFVWYLDSDSQKAPGIRQFLNTKDKYKVWKDLKRRVIDPSVNEINEKCTDMYISYEILKNKWVYAIELTLATYDLSKVIDQDILPGQMSIYDEEKENPRSNRRISGRNTKLQNVRVDKLIKFNSDILYNWLDDEERKKRSRTEL